LNHGAGARYDRTMLDVVYDGRCGFCARSLDICTRLARRPIFRLHDANDREAIGTRFPMLATADTDAAMFVVTESGEVFRGFFAFRRMMWTSPWLFPFLPFFYAPGASLIGPRVYDWVARNRGRLGGTAACSLPASPANRPKTRS